MSTKNNDANKKMLLSTINEYDTIKSFMEKCNSNFLKISQNGGGPAGVQGEEGSQGAPTKPKVPIHAWKKGKEEDGCQYKNEIPTQNGFEINEWYEDLSNSIYQNGHLIILENGHVYTLEIDEADNFTLKPNYIISLQTYDPSDVIDGKNAYVHIAYTNNVIDFDGFETDQQLRGDELESGDTTTFNLIRTLTDDVTYSDKPYIGIYTDHINMPSYNPDRYTWVKVKGEKGETGEKGDTGEKGEKGEKGDTGEKGDSFTGNPYVIDLEGDMSTISIDVDRTRLYDDDFCECILHAYYGNKSEKINASDVEIILPDEYKYLNDNNIVLKSDESNVGTIEKIQSNNDVIIKFIPDENFVFPKKTITFSIHIETSVHDEDDDNDYDFVRDTVWMIKGIMSTFELEIVPEYRTIKLFENGEYYPEKLLVDVYKVEDAERTKFDFSQNTDFKLLYKSVNENDWQPYPTEGISTDEASGFEFKVVRYHETENEEMWDHEDVWVVADGKGTHYYHADLGATESMMVLTTGNMIEFTNSENEKIYCAELRNESGYSITFEPKFYDGSEELDVKSVNFGSINGGEQYVAEGTFVRELKGSTLTITKVPYGVEVIPMTINVIAECPTYDKFGNVVENKYISKTDTVSFNVYITTISDLYSLVPTVSSYNTSTGKDGDTIGCEVYKNNNCIATATTPSTELNTYGLTLKYIVHSSSDTNTEVVYSEPLVYGDDSDIPEDEFTASDVAIEFILYYRGKEVVRSTVPLIKDGIDGRDGDCWQYIFYRSNKYPFDKTIMSDPSDWSISNDDLSNPDNEYILEGSGWCDDHKGVDSTYKYEYQSYRKWDKIKKCWGKYGSPTLYSNFSENGSGYTVILSNPVSVIPVGDDNWATNEGLSTQADSTLVYLYNNTKDLSTDSNVSIRLQDPEDNKYVKNGNFSIEDDNGENSINKVVFRPVVNNSTFDFEGNTQYKLPIIVTYDLGEDYDKFETTINWTLTPIRGLEDVEVFVDKNIVNISTNKVQTFKVGYNLISSNGTTQVRDNNTNTNTKNYNIFLTNDITDLGDAVTDWSSASYDFTNSDNCYVVLTDNSNNKNIIDYTSITAVIDGAKGDTVTCTSVEVVGYSLDSNVWEDSIDKLGNIPAGSKIYIKTRYKYSDGTQKDVITVTMAGTQGDTGRTLFYLGSFKDGTLKEEPVTGLLNKDRCDYYIDANDQPWMRTGTAETAEGYKNEEGGTQNNTDYWTKSKKIGFLQAGAISAEMINAKSLVGSKVIANAVNAATISANNIQTGKISSTNTKSYFDLDNGDFVLGNALEYKGGVLTIGGINEDSDEDISDILERLGIIETNISDVSDAIANEEKARTQAIANLETIQKSLQSQIDGEITSWFLEGEPTTTNKPASDWTGTDENGVAFDYRQRHEGDTYTNINNATNEHFNNPDLWENGSTKDTIGNTYEQDKTASTYRLRTKELLKNNGEKITILTADWQLFIQYYNSEEKLAVTDPYTTSRELNKSYPYYTILLKKSNGSTAITPSMISTLSIVVEGKSDYDPTAGQSWRWCNVDDEYGTGWHWHKIADSDAVKALQEAAKAQSTADGKSTTFIEEPKNYDIGDLWILAADRTLNGNTYKQGTILTANAASATFVASHWGEKVKYIDESIAAQQAQQALDGLDLGVRNLWAKKYIMDWNDTYADTTTKGSDVYGEYYDIYEGRLYTYIGNSGSYDDILQNKVSFEADKQYVLQVKWRNLQKTISDGSVSNGLYIRFNYSDGKKSDWIICLPEYIVPTTSTLVSAKGKTVTGVSCTYGTSPNTRIYEIQLVQANKQPNDWMVAPEDVDSKADAIKAIADGAAESAKQSNDQLANMSNDSILTPQEKGSVADEWAYIQKEYTQNSANKTTVWGNATVAEWTAYNNAYTTLQNYVSTLALTDRTNNTTIVKSTFQTNFANYYSTNVAFLNALSKKVAELEVSALDYLKEAITDGSTEITGGLTMTNVLMLKSLQDGSNKEPVVTAGMSGMTTYNGKKDNVLMWGGGTYQDAFAAANSNTYNTGSGTITTLIKKDGTGKIGAFWIDDDTIRVVTGTQSIIITNKSINDLKIANGYDVSNKNGFTISANNNVLNQIEKKENHVLKTLSIGSKDISGFGKYKISIGEIVCTVTADNSQSGENGEYAKATIGNFKLSITGQQNKELKLYDASTNKYENAFELNSGLSKVIKTFKIISQEFTIDNTTEGKISVALTCDYYLENNKNSANNAVRSEIKIEFKNPISIISTEKATVLSRDGFFTLSDGNHSFFINNSDSGGKMKIIARGLPSFDSVPTGGNTGLEPGQLYSVGGILRVQQ